MEQIRAQQGPMSFAANQNAPPDYDNVDDVQNDVTALMSRMKNLTDFIHNQNDLATSMGDDKPELMEEQIQLQKKLNELKSKKQQMANLVNELQTMNIQADNNFDSRDEQQQSSAPRNIVGDYERMVPIDLFHGSRLNGNVSGAQLNRYNPAGVALPKNSNDIVQPSIGISAQPVPAAADADEEDEDDEGATVEQDDLLHDKIAEINAMKDQLKRLQDMMQTVKLIEIKNGDCNPDEALNFNAKPITELNTTPNNSEDPQRDDEEQEMAERVRALHNMTNDLRQQAVSLAAERDRLKNIKNEMARRRDDGSEKNFKQQQQQLTAASSIPKDQDLETEYEAKKNEFQNIVEKLDSNETGRPKKESSQPPEALFYAANNWPSSRQHNASSTSSLRSGNADGQQSDTLSTKPAPSNCNQGKDSADSGAADVLNMSVEAGSLQSGSSRGFSVPPPMRNIGGRDGNYYHCIHFDVPNLLKFLF